MTSPGVQNLDTFLADQRSGVFDSTGAFTISAEKALEKLAQSQLPEPYFWVLKVAQFATVRGETEMQVSIKRGYCRVVVPLSTPLHLSDFGEALSSVKPVADRASNHLVTALRAIGGMTERRFALMLTNPAEIEYLLWDGKKLSSSKQDGRDQTSELCLEVALPNRGALETMAQVMGSVLREGEAKVLMERAFTAPYALSLGKFRIEQFRRDSLDQWRETIFWDSLRSETGIQLPHFLSSSAQQKTCVSAFWCVKYHYDLLHQPWAPSPDPTPIYFSSSIHWLSDGVVVKKELLKGPGSPYSLELYVEASELPTDLGGLDFRLSEEFAQKRNWVRRLIQHISKKAPEKIQTFERLSGNALPHWDALVTSTKLLPIGVPVEYKSRSRNARKLQALPGFRKKLVAKVKEGPFPFDKLKLNKLL